MRLAVAAALGSLVFAQLALAAPGDRAAATFGGSTLTLTLHYLMTCGEPGPGPLTIRLPQAFRLNHVTVAGRASSVSGHTVSVTIPGPTGVTCMSITEGTLRVRVTGLHAAAGRYVLTAKIRTHAFAARLRVG